MYKSTSITLLLTLLVSHVTTRYGPTEDRHLHNPEKSNYTQSRLAPGSTGYYNRLTTKTQLHANAYLIVALITFALISCHRKKRKLTFSVHLAYTNLIVPLTIIHCDNPNLTCLNLKYTNSVNASGDMVFKWFCNFI